MKQIILFVTLFIFLLFSSKQVFAIDPEKIKLGDCKAISITLPFQNYENDSSTGEVYNFCHLESDISYSNVRVGMNGIISKILPYLPEESTNPNVPNLGGSPLARTEKLTIGETGSIFFWGPPWGDGPDPVVQYRFKTGGCIVTITGSALTDIKYVMQEGYKPDWKSASEYMIKTISEGVKQVESHIAAPCGGKNSTGAVDNSGQSSGNSPSRNYIGWVGGVMVILIVGGAVWLVKNHGQFLKGTRRKK